VTLGFRLYNRIETLVALRDADFDTQVMLTLDNVFSTAYKINVKGGLFNVASVAKMVRSAFKEAKYFAPRDRLEYAVGAVKGAVGAGPFVSYQTALDLRWLYGPYIDEYEWCILGIGACRGLARLYQIYETNIATANRYRADFEEMQRRLGITSRIDGVSLSKQAKVLLTDLLPRFREVIPTANLSEVEHNLCEFDKYERVRTGEGKGISFKPKG
jgi:alpha-glutamyl/putrescinyl thymine pyrophosphorylase clade 1